MSKAKEVLNKLGVKESIGSNLSKSLDKYYAEVEEAGKRMAGNLKDSFKKIQKSDPKLEWVEIIVEEDEGRESQSSINVATSVSVGYDGEEIDAFDCENEDVVYFADVASNAGPCLDAGTTKFE